MYVSTCIVTYWSYTIEISVIWIFINAKSTGFIYEVNLPLGYDDGCLEMILTQTGFHASQLQSSRMDFMLRLPNCTDKHQMLIILTNPTSDIWILRLTKQTCWRDFGKTAVTFVYCSWSCLIVFRRWLCTTRVCWNNFCCCRNKVCNTNQGCLSISMPVV